MDKSMERVMWQVIEDMDFNTRGYDGAGEYLANESGLNFKGMKQVEEFARKKVSNLYDILGDINGVSDDSLSDLTWQIVANGEEFYNNITLEKAQEMVDNMDYNESFSYAFHILYEV